MSTTHSNSRLQRLILLSINHGDFRTVTEIARTVTVSRPSVSRAITALKTAGLVTKSEKYWRLTDSGQETVRYLEDEIPAQLQQAVQAATRLTEQSAQIAQFLKPAWSEELGQVFQQITKLQTSVFPKLPITSMFQFPIANPTAFMRATPAIETLVAQIASMNAAKTQEMLDTFMHVTVPSLQSLPSINETLTSFMKSQQLSLNVIARSASENGSAQILKGLSATNLGLGQIIADIGNISGFSALGSRNGIATLMPYVADIGKAYESYFHEIVDALTSPLDTRFGLRLIVPTQTTATFVHTVRDIIETETQGSLEHTLKIDWQEQATHFDDFFRSVGPKYIKLWQGAWTTLYSTSPDRFRQATHSGRELLMQILDELAPDSVFTASEIVQYGHGQVTRKMRISHITKGRSDTEVEWAETLAKGSEAIYKRLVGIAHDRSVQPAATEQQIAGTLITLAGLLISLTG